MKIDRYTASDRPALEDLARFAYVVYDRGMPLLPAQGYLPAVPPLPKPYDEDPVVIPFCRDVSRRLQDCLDHIGAENYNYTIREDAFFSVGRKRDIVGFLRTFIYSAPPAIEEQDRIWFAFLDPGYASRESVDVGLLLALRKKKK